jgi:hypothetical protein
MKLLPFALATGALVSGCGDNPPPGVDPPPDGGIPEPTGDFTHPDDFPREGCAAGGFAGGHPQGIYHLRLDFGGGFERALAMRVDELGGGVLGGMLSGRDADVVYQYGDDDVILQWQVGGDLRAVDLCAKDGDTVVGTYASCTEGQEPACSTMAIDGKLLHRLDEEVAEGMTLLGEFGGDWPVDFFTTGVSVNVRVADNRAYVARYEDGLRIVDVTDPSAMVELGHLMPESADQGEIYNDVKVVGHYALMASDYHGVVVVDVADPAAPAIVAHIGDGNTHTLFVDGGRAYTATYGPGLEIWDVADPAQPVRLGAYLIDDSAYLHDLFVSGNRAYLNFWDFGMAIVDVSDPTEPGLLGVFANYGQHSSHSNWVTHVGNRDIAIHGDEQWGAHVHIVDVTEGTPAFATSIGEWQTRPEVSVHNIMAMGSLAVMAHYQDGIRVLDLADPTAPVEVAHYDTWPGYDRDYGKIFFEGAIGLDLDVANRNVYVADSHRGLLVLHLD